MLTAMLVRLDMPLVFKSRLRLRAVADFQQYILSVAAYLTAGPSCSAGRDRKLWQYCRYFQRAVCHAILTLDLLLLQTFRGPGSAGR